MRQTEIELATLSCELIQAERRLDQTRRLFQVGDESAVRMAHRRQASRYAGPVLFADSGSHTAGKHSTPKGPWIGRMTGFERQQLLETALAEWSAHCDVLGVSATTYCSGALAEQGQKQLSPAERHNIEARAASATTMQLASLPGASAGSSSTRGTVGNCSRFMNAGLCASRETTVAETRERLGL